LIVVVLAGCYVSVYNQVIKGIVLDKRYRDTLKAYASKSLLIENKAVGYKITYFLDKFEYYRSGKSFIFSGSIVFNEDLTAGLTEREVFAGTMATQRIADWLPYEYRIR